MMFGKPLSLHSTTLKGREIIVTDLPYPPQLKEAMGYKTNIELLGIWYLVNGKLSEVSFSSTAAKMEKLMHPMALF